MLLLLWRADCPYRWSLARSGLPARTRFVAFFVLRDISLCSLSRDSAAQRHRIESMYSSRRRGSNLRLWAAGTAWLVFLGRNSVAGELAPPPLYTSQIDTMRVLSFSESAPRLSAIRVLTFGRRGLQFCFRRCVRDSLRPFRNSGTDARHMSLPTDSYSATGYDPDQGVNNIPGIGEVSLSAARVDPKSRR